MVICWPLPFRIKLFALTVKAGLPEKIAWDDPIADVFQPVEVQLS